MKALVVEPSRMYQLLLNEFLNGFSISHDVVTTGDAALAELAKSPVDLIIIAMTLSDTLATALARQIKTQEQFSDVIVIIMTGEQDQEKLDQMKTPGVNHVCQRNELTQFKDILTDLTRNDSTVCHVAGHVLYIEDHLTIANMTMDILKQMGLTFDHSTSAEQGLVLFEENNYDLVLLDIVLSGKKDGIDMIREVRARKDEKNLIPILTMSANSKATDRIHALQVGANDFIIKPVLQAELAVRVKNLIIARQLHLKIISQQQAFEELAMTDQLTGLNNRYYLDSFIGKALSLAKRHNYPLSIVMIDLDKFKYINDTFGHEQGDEVLVNISSVLQNSCRIEDIAIRLGGDEFLIILPHCPEDKAIIKATELCALFNAIESSNPEVVVAASFGVSSTKNGVYFYKDLFDLADKAAYQSKADGGNTVHCLS